MIVNYIHRLAKVFTGSTKPQIDFQHGKTFKAIRMMFGRLRAISSMKILEAVMAAPEAAWNFQELLPKEFRSFASVIVTSANLPEELKALQSAEHDWEVLSGKLSLFENLASAAGMNMLSDEMFQHLQAPVQAYLDEYLPACRKPMDEIGLGLLHELKQAKDKFGGVVSCAETWQMEPMMVIFDADEEEIKAELEGISHNLTSLQTFCNGMRAVAGHSTSHPKFKVLIDDFNKFLVDSTSMIQDMKKVGTYLIVASELLAPSDGAVKENVQEALKFCSQEFGISKEIISGKLLKMVNDALANKKPQQNKSNAAPAKKVKAVAGADSKEKDAAAAPKKRSRAPKEEKEGKDKKKTKKWVDWATPEWQILNFLLRQSAPVFTRERHGPHEVLTKQNKTPAPK